MCEALVDTIIIIIFGSRRCCVCVCASPAHGIGIWCLYALLSTLPPHLFLLHLRYFLYIAMRCGWLIEICSTKGREYWMREIHVIIDIKSSLNEIDICLVFRFNYAQTISMEQQIEMLQQRCCHTIVFMFLHLVNIDYDTKRARTHMDEQLRLFRSISVSIFRQDLDAVDSLHRMAVSSVSASLSE